MEITLSREKKGSWRLIFPKFNLPKSCAICKKKKFPFKVHKTTFFGDDSYSIVPYSILKLNFEIVEVPFSLREYYIPLSAKHNDLGNLSNELILKGINVFLDFLSKENSYVLGTIQRGIVNRGTFSHPQIRIFCFDLLPPNIIMRDYNYRYDSLNALKLSEKYELISMIEQLKNHTMHLTFFYNKSEFFIFLRKGIDKLWPVSIFSLIGFDIKVESDEFT